ncbi:MAG: HutD family protein [Paracoccaceae bacterium]
MRIILPADFQTQPWKNGGGITHEIAREDAAGSLLWRLSIAEVASDGPFSAFTGLSRILTVIDGAGLWLDTPHGRLDALPLRPLPFSGDLPVSSRMIDGPIRDFNLIFNGERLTGSVEHVTAARVLPGVPGRQYALLTLSDGATVNEVNLPTGAVALFNHANLTASPALSALLVQLDPH